MTPEAFNRWLETMKATGKARSHAECARLLGVSKNGLQGMKKNGTDYRTSLACAALLHDIKPFT